MSDPHPIFALLEMMHSNLAMDFVRVKRSGNDVHADEILAKIDAVEGTQEIAKEMYG